MRTFDATVALLLAVFAVSACRRTPTHNPSPAPTAAPADARPPPPPELAVSLRWSEDDGGTAETLKPAEPSIIEPVQKLEVQASARLRNFRIRVFDESDRALESDDVLSETDAGTRDEISLRFPLKPGRRYDLVLDPQTGPLLQDALGNTFPEVRFTLQTSGERQRDAKTPGAAKRRHHR